MNSIGSRAAVLFARLFRSVLYYLQGADRPPLFSIINIDPVNAFLPKRAINAK